MIERFKTLLEQGKSFGWHNFASMSENGYPQSYSADYISWKATAATALRRLLGTEHPIVQTFQEGEQIVVLGWDMGHFEDAHSRFIGALAAALGELQVNALISMVEAQLPDEEPISGVRRACARFHQVARSLRKRHDGRPTLDVVDEYDVQDLLRSLLWLYVDDIRPEDPAPTTAGASSRVDFILSGYGIAVEVKKTRPNLADRQLGEQLAVDIIRYRSHPECRHLVCLIYDPDERIANPSALKKDLEAQSDDQLTIEIIISPRHI